MPQMSGAEALTKSLQQYGIDTIFALPGAQLDPMFGRYTKHVKHSGSSTRAMSKARPIWRSVMP